MDRLFFRREPIGFGLSRIAGMVGAIHRALERSRQRRALHGLSDAMLRDIGLSRRDVTRETAKPFWRR
jgi:uncharacterized protein YjiS (DUF1127 family)